MIKEVKSDILIKINLRQVMLFLILIQSCGIRFFEGQGSLLMVFIIGIGLRSIKLFTKEDWGKLFGIFSFLLFLKLLNSSFTFFNLLYFFGNVFQVFLFLIPYRYSVQLEKIEEDIFKVLKLLFIHAGLCCIGYFLVGGLFTQTSFSGYPYQTFFNLLFVDREGRTTGLFWEPGVLQLMLNILLFISISQKKSLILLGLISITVLSTQSTTGFLVLGLNFFFFISRHINIKRLKTIIGLILAAILAVSVYSLVEENISKKFDVRNTSGLIRYRDFFIGSQLIIERPFWGHGIYHYTHLTTKDYVIEIEENLFSEFYLQRSGAMSGGYTNGLMAVFTWFGLPLGFLIYFMFYNNQIFFKKRFILFSIFALSLVSEPISYTSFFLIFPLSYIILRNFKRHYE